jgi:hypothetical protein
VSKLSTNFEEILLHTHGNFEEQSKVMEISIIINYCIIIIDLHYSSVINAYCHHYTSNKGLVEECNMGKKNLEASTAAAVSCFRRSL